MPDKNCAITILTLAFKKYKKKAKYNIENSLDFTSRNH